MAKNIERMGYVPCYKFLKPLREDEEFEYFEIRVPRQYIREHIAEGGEWPGYEETEEEGTRDSSIVLGVIYYPAIPNPEPLREDADFMYYEIKVPKEVLEMSVRGSKLKYRVLYESQTYKLETPEEKAERESESIECAEFVPKAGTVLSGTDELEIVRKVKEQDVDIYEVEVECKGCSFLYAEVTSDIFDTLSGLVCPSCYGTNFHLKAATAVIREE